MNRSRFGLIFATILVLGGCMGDSPSVTAPSSPATNAEPTPSASIDLTSELDALVSGADGFQGSALVGLGDEVLLDKGYGMADIAKGIANAPETRFRLGSITKQFTAMAILILQSRGKLDVQDAACSYLPECPPAWKEITIRQLLSHTTGVPDYTNLTSFNLTRDEASTPAQLLVRITDLPLDFAPGTEFAYSSSGFVALGAIIEQVSGMSYEAFLQQEIFVPLGMHDTGYDTGNDGLATGYKDATTVADPIDPSVYFAAGALYSTVLDMHRWDQALYTDQLVPLGLLATMFKPAVTIPGAQGLAYGYGFFVGTSVDDPWAGHDGSIEGFETWYVRHSKNRLSVVFLSNREGDIGYEQLDRSITDLVLHR